MAWPLTSDPISSYTSLMTATWDANLGMFRNNIYDVNHTIALLESKGFMKPYTKGGVGLIVPLMYGTNSTMAWGRHSYDTVDLTPQEGFGPAQYSKAWFAGSLTFSKDEEEDNKGEEAIFSLYEAKVKQLQFAARKQLQDSVYTGTNGGTNPERILGIDEIISTTQSIGGIDPTARTWWAPKARTAADFDDMTTAISGIMAMELLQTDCTFGGFSPSVYPCNSTVWQAVIRMMVNKSQFPLVGTKEATGRISWNSVAFKNGSIFEDTDIPAANGNVMYFLTPEALTLYYLPSSNYQLTPPVTPNNAFAWSRLTRWRGGMVTDLRRVHGKLTCNGLV